MLRKEGLPSCALGFCVGLTDLELFFNPNFNNHFFRSYGHDILGTVSYGLFLRSFLSPKLAFPLAFTYGCITELGQGLGILGGTFDIYDFLAFATGTLIAFHTDTLVTYSTEKIDNILSDSMKSTSRILG